MVASSAACTAVTKRTWPSEGGATVKLTITVRRHTERRRLQVRLADPFARQCSAHRCNFMALGACSGGRLSRCHDR